MLIALELLLCFLCLTLVAKLILFIWDKTPKLDPFAIEQTNDVTTFVEARNFKIARDGRLVFYSWPWKREAAYQAGVWVRVMRGVGPGDLEDEAR